MAKPQNLSGKRFGKLVAVEFSGSSDCGKRMWRCLCDCGSVVYVTAGNLASGNSRSCGCVAIERIAKIRRSHGRSSEAEYRIWLAMKARCNNKNVKCFIRYGGRGIRVCDEWNTSYQAFIAYMGPRPSQKHTIDRIDNDGPYAPWNCRWATISEQCRNKRNNAIVTINGQSKTVAEWAALTGMPFTTLAARVRNKWPENMLLEKRRIYAGKVIG